MLHVNISSTRILYTRPRLRALMVVLPLGSALLTGGCASYTPRSLSANPDLVSAVPHLQVKAATLPLPALRHHAFNPDDGLDMTEVAILAVINNPELKAQRRKADVARAQLFAAHLLPDPQLSLNSDHPTGGGAGLTNAYGVGLNYDLTRLVTRGAGIDAARHTAAQVDLDILWQEWQVVQQARRLYIHSVQQAHKLVLLRRARDLYAARYARSAKALKDGNLTLDVTGTDLTALLDANTRLNDLERQVNRTRHRLNALLGLAPNVRLELVLPPRPRPLTHVAVQQALADLSARRPDLLALQAGYRSQEAKVRRAILAQFPSLGLGITRARDTGGVHTDGFGITLNLPLFDGNRGEIAIQRATRAQLAQEYRARLDQARGQADLVLTQQVLIRRQLDAIGAKLPALARMVRQARRVYASRDLDALTYLNLENTLLNKELERVDLDQALWDNRITLDTLLAWPDAALVHTQETKP